MSTVLSGISPFMSKSGFANEIACRVFTEAKLDDQAITDETKVAKKSKIKLPSQKHLRELRDQMDMPISDSLQIYRQRMRKLNTRASTQAGIPLVLWHGIDSPSYDDFSRSRTPQGVYWFSTEKELSCYRGSRECQQPRAVHLLVKAPATALHIQEYAKELGIVIELGRELHEVMKSPRLYRKVISYGHDGFFAHEKTWDGNIIISWGVISSDQIIELKGSEIDEAVEQMNASEVPVTRVR